MNNLKNIFKKNQVIIAALAIMIIVAGYLNFTKGKIGDKAGNSDVETNVQIPEEQLDIETTGNDGSSLSNEDVDAENSKKSEAGEAVLANNKISSDYFVSNKLKREQTRAKSEETLKGIINNDKLKDSQKQDAINEMIELTDIKEKEAVTESLLEAKGFPESLVTITDGKVEVIVNANNLTEQQMAQIEDVVKRKTGIAAKNIVISPVTVSDTSADGKTEDVTNSKADSASEENSAKSSETKKESTTDTKKEDTSKSTTKESTTDEKKDTTKDSTSAE